MMYYAYNWHTIQLNRYMRCGETFKSITTRKSYTVQCCYNAVNLVQNLHKRHPIARPLGRDMGCLLVIQILIYILLWITKRCPLSHPNGWYMGCLLVIQILIYILLQSLQWCTQYHVILDCVITAPDCSTKFIMFFTYIIIRYIELLRYSNCFSQILNYTWHYCKVCYI